MQQQQQSSASPTKQEPISRQQQQQEQQQYTSPTLVIQPDNRSSTTGSMRRPQYTSSNNLVSDEIILPSDDTVDDSTIHDNLLQENDNESISVAIASISDVVVSTSIDGENTGTATNADNALQNSIDGNTMERFGGNETNIHVSNNRSIRAVTTTTTTTSQTAPSVVFVESMSTTNQLQRRSTPSVRNNRQSFRHVSDRTRPEIELNLEEDDNILQEDNDFDSNSMSTACGWTEVMSSSLTTTGRGTGGGMILPRPGNGIVEGLVGFNTNNNNNNNTTMPSPRSLHSAALLNGVMYIFGGYDGTQRVNSFHAYTFADKRWSPVLPSANSGNPPSPRDRHVSVAFANSFYVHGGFDGIARDASLFSFDFSTMAWREVIASQGRPPSARHSHAAVVHNHSMYIFGGYDGSYKSDLHEFDFTLSRWSAVPAVGRRPRPRYRATCVVYKDLMILYGGHDGTKHLSDTFTFDFNTLTWNTLITDGVQPIPRDSHVAVVHGNSMYIFGGSSGVALNDFHELQLPCPVAGAVINTGSATAQPTALATSQSPTSMTAARWRPIRTCQSETSHQPNRRFCHVAVTYNDSIYVFGGYDGSDRLNSFIKFDFAMYDLSFDIPPSVLINDLRSFVNDESLSDITFIVEDEPIYAHKLMLMRCSYFQALFSGHMRESSMDTIRIEQVRYPIFLGILEYLYTDQLTSMPYHAAMEYFEAADLFCIPRLKTMCEKRMLQHITIDSAPSIFHAADVHSATALRQKAKKYILTHFEDVSKTSSFEDMGRQNVDLVFELLQSR